jgi:hypothetical protein
MLEVNMHIAHIVQKVNHVVFTIEKDVDMTTMDTTIKELYGYVEEEKGMVQKLTVHLVVVLHRLPKPIVLSVINRVTSYPFSTQRILKNVSTKVYLCLVWE